MTTGEWMCANTRVRGKPFNFKGYEFQREIADDLHPNLDVIKISQVGLTEIQQRKALAFLVRNPGTTGIFSLPNEKMYRRFSQSRLKPMIEENKVFKPTQVEAPVRSMDLMQFGMSFLNIVNATEGSATSTSADFVFMDEVDISDQKALALFASRLQNSSHRIKQRFSTPSWTGFGIDSTYSISDMREYYCKCNACNMQQIPLFTKEFVYLKGLPDSLELSEITDEVLHKLDLDGAFVMCKRCGAPLELDNPNREWVATHPTRENNRGYRVRPFSSARIDIPYIVNQLVDYTRKDYVRGWHNTVIGEGYSDARARLDEGQIKACYGSPQMPVIDPSAPVFLGLDMGQVCHLTLGTPAPNGVGCRVFEFRTVPVNQLDMAIFEIMTRYNLINGACDRHPYTPTAEAIRDLTDGRIMPMEYRGDQELKPVKSVEDVVTHWQANRTKLLDEVARHVRQKLFLFEGFGQYGAVVTSHLRDQIRDETPESPAKWIKLTGVDHYAHSLAFLLAAIKLQGVANSIGVQDHRMTLMIAGFRSPLQTPVTIT